MEENKMNKNLRLFLSLLASLVMTALFYVNKDNGFNKFFNALNPCYKRPGLGIAGPRGGSWVPWFCPPDLSTQRMILSLVYYLIIFVVFFIAFDWLMRVISKKIR